MTALRNHKLLTLAGIALVWRLMFILIFPGPNTLATIQAIPALYGDTLVRVSVVPVSGASVSVPALLPEAGGALGALPLVVLGLALIAAGYRVRRVRVS